MNAALGILRVGITIFRNVTPGALAKVRTALFGRSIAIVGPSGAGKTSFSDYLRFGLFHREQDHQSTTRTKSHPKFEIGIGSNANLELRVKNFVDTPGQYTPENLLEIILNKKPHAIMVFLDASHPISPNGSSVSTLWLEKFSRELEREFVRNSKRLKNLQHTAIILNKIDKVSKDDLDKIALSVRNILNTELRISRGGNREDFRLSNCILVQNSEGTTYVDDIISDLVKSLSDKG